MSATAAVGTPAVRGRTREAFRIDVPFSKDVDGTEGKAVRSGDLILRGYASTWVMDRDGEYVHPNAFDKSLQPYLDKNPLLLWQHNPDWPIGTVEEAVLDSHGLGVRAHVPKPEKEEPDWKHLAYHSMDKGVVRTFSIGGFFYREPGEAAPIITDIELMEISVVSIPSNPDSLFEAAAKAVGGESRRPVLPPKAIEQMAQLLGMRTVSDPELAAMTLTERAARYKQLAELYERTGHRAPPLDGWLQVVKATTVADKLKRTLEVLRMVQPQAPVAGQKEGRVLSKANEAALRHAADLLNGVLSKLPQQAEVEQDA